MHYFDIKSKQDLIDYVKYDFYKPDDYFNTHVKYGKQIGGKALPGAFMWCIFKSSNEYTCICVRKDSLEEVVICTGKSYEDMLNNFIELITTRWKLHV